MSVGVFHLEEQFFSNAKQMKHEFARKFSDPLTAHAQRFVWDYWHIANEYTLLRTPAYRYFSPAVYNRFHRYLVQWGRENLGCHDISPPWLSCYIEGCRQEQHVDQPHGPLAFVFSLTDWDNREFSGGETFLNISVRRQRLIKPKFNQLTLFNPAVPHGVRPVRGTHDPGAGRLVINGWFVNPRPFWVGPLTARQVQMGLDRGLPAIIASVMPKRRAAASGRDDQPSLGQGLLSVRINIAAHGGVIGTQVLTNTLIGAHPRVVRNLIERLYDLQFAKQKTKTALTLPLICQ